ncbi:MAG: GGDEF domain-containing protein [bacterium]
MDDKMTPEQNALTKDPVLAEEAADLFHTETARKNWHNDSKDVQTEVLDVFERQVVPRERNNQELRAELETEKMADLVGRYGVYSRNALDSRLMYIARKNLTEGGGEGTLVLIGDLDNLKLLNETSKNEEYGHAIGDAGLCAAAEVLVENTRMGDTVARIGGDEFAVICKVGSSELAKGIVEGAEGVSQRGLIERVRRGIEERRQKLIEEYGADWPPDTEKKKPGQLSMGWSFFSAEELGELYQQYERNNETGANINGDFVSMVVKKADKDMFKDKRSKD